jgi:hypothetical protein
LVVRGAVFTVGTVRKTPSRDTDMSAAQILHIAALLMAIAFFAVVLTA